MNATHRSVGKPYVEEGTACTVAVFPDSPELLFVVGVVNKFVRQLLLFFLQLLLNYCRRFVSFVSNFWMTPKCQSSHNSVESVCR